jgi:uncharacterized membrane protein
MPEDVTTLDIAAAAWFLLGWIGYVILQAHPRGEGLNQRMNDIRRAWMAQFVERGERIVDSGLIGHSIHSITFFASTTMLVLGGLIGLLGAVDRIHDVLGTLAFAARTSQAMVEFKLFALIGAFAFGFFQFTWALRQYNYLCALIGSAPLPKAPAETKASAARHLARVMSLAVASFNGGLRAYYFAIALVAWFVHPIAFIAMTTLVLAVLIRRQRWSRTVTAIRSECDTLKVEKRL